MYWCPPGVWEHPSLFCLSLWNLLAHIRLPYIRWKGTSIALIWGMVACPTPRGCRDMRALKDMLNPPSYFGVVFCTCIWLSNMLKNEIITHWELPIQLPREKQKKSPPPAPPYCGTARDCIHSQVGPLWPHHTACEVIAITDCVNRWHHIKNKNGMPFRTFGGKDLTVFQFPGFSVSRFF